KRVMQSRNLDSAGLSNLLSSQRDNIEAAMPRPREVTEETYPRPVVPTEPRKRSMGWVLPVALLALLAGLLWHWGSRSPVSAGHDESGLAQTTSLESLKAKYSSAIRIAREQGVQISSMTEQDGKLVIRGTSPSAEVINSVQEEIRRTNPAMDDVVLNLSVSPQTRPTP